MTSLALVDPDLLLVFILFSVLDVDVTLKTLTLRKKISDQLRIKAASPGKQSAKSRFRLGLTLGRKKTLAKENANKNTTLNRTTRAMTSSSTFSPLTYGATLSSGFQPEQLQRTREVLKEEKEIVLPPQTICGVIADPNDGRKLKLVFVDR